MARDMKAFITGSRAYGRPKTSSDIDLVVRMDCADADLLRDFLGGSFDPYDGTDTTSVKVGNLNLLITISDDVYDAWHTGTLALKAMAPVSRADAAKLINSLRGVK